MKRSYVISLLSVLALHSVALRPCEEITVNGILYRGYVSCQGADNIDFCIIDENGSVRDTTFLIDDVEIVNKCPKGVDSKIYDRITMNNGIRLEGYVLATFPQFKLREKSNTILPLNRNNIDREEKIIPPGCKWEDEVDYYDIIKTSDKSYKGLIVDLWYDKYVKILSAKGTRTDSIPYSEIVGIGKCPIGLNVTTATTAINANEPKSDAEVVEDTAVKETNVVAIVPQRNRIEDLRVNGPIVINITKNTTMNIDNRNTAKVDIHNDESLDDYVMIEVKDFDEAYKIIKNENDGRMITIPLRKDSNHKFGIAYFSLQKNKIYVFKRR